MIEMARKIAMEMIIAEMAMVGRVSGTIMATGFEEKGRIEGESEN